MRQFIFGAAFGLSAAVIALPTIGAASSKEDYQALDLIADVFKRVYANYVHEMSVTELADKAVSAFLRSLDPHSSYMNAQEMKAMTARPDSATASAGLTLTIRNGLLRVLVAADNSPAAQGGIKSGDYLLAIDGQSTNEMTIEEAIEKLQGLKNTDLKLTVRHRLDLKAQGIVIQRADIDARPDVIVKKIGHLGYVRITRFAQDTAEHLRDAIERTKKEVGPGLKGYIIDLRNNPGGLLDGGIRVADVMLDKGIIVSTHGRNREDNYTYSAAPGDATDGKPIVLLINEGSAAGSEIVAAALQDNHRATILGMPSFGEGTVQTVIPVPGGGAIKLTTAEFFAPSGRPIQLEGVVPDVAVSDAVESDGDTEDRITEAQLVNHLGSTSDRAQASTILYPTGDELKTDFQLAKAIARLNAN